MTSAAIVHKLWNYCNVLRDDLSVCDSAQAVGMCDLKIVQIGRYHTGRINQGIVW
jgi:hypothetical protein